MGLIDVDVVFRKVQTARPAARQELLQEAVGARTDNPIELNHRACLMTRLRHAGLWPVHVTGDSAFEDGA